MIKVHQVYNEQRSMFGGEAAVIEMMTRQLEMHGNVSTLVKKSSRGIEGSLLRKAGAFCGGIYNFKSYHEMQRLLRDDPPDLVHVHSVYPMFSPSVLVACRRAGIPVVMTVHSQILTCPTWYHLYKGSICEECVGGREYRCVQKNCRDNLLESLAYALRSGFARKFRLFHDNVTLFMVLTDFAKGKLMAAGFREEQIVVVPNATSVTGAVVDPAAGEYVAFAGRLSPEKGVETLLAAALKCSRLKIKIAGDGPLLAELAAKAPANVEFVGRLSQAELADFYRKARLVVVPSICFEQFPIVAVEAMALGLPIIASRIGGLPEVLNDGVTGLLFEPGNFSELADQILLLWADPERCERMGRAGRQKVISTYNLDDYYSKLIGVYGKAVEMARNARP